MPESFRDLSARTKLRISGADRIRFLNGQTTNDVRKASAAVAQESCILNAKGHLEAHLFLLAEEAAIFCDAAPELRETLPARLDRYIIADDVTVEDVSEQFALFHFLEAAPPSIAGERFRVRAMRLGVEGDDLWLDRNAAEGAREVWRANGWEELSDEAWEARRIENGLPRWGRELGPDILPPEANLAARAIDYLKGCYIGQETISRMKMSGQMRQTLCGLRAENGAPLQVNDELRVGEKAVGKITSAVVLERLGGPVALALIKRGFNAPGTDLTTSSGAKVVVQALPFVAEKR